MNNRTSATPGHRSVGRSHRIAARTPPGPKAPWQRLSTAIDQLLAEPAGYALVLQRLKQRERQLLDPQPRAVAPPLVSEGTPVVPAPPVPTIVMGAARFSHKTRKLSRTISVNNETHIIVTGSQRGLEDTATHILSDAAWARKLCDTLLAALLDAPRLRTQVRTHRREFKELAAVAYCFIGEQQNIPEQYRSVALSRADAELRQHTGDIPKRERRWRLAAFLLHRGAPSLRRKVVPRNPLADDFEPESFFRRHVQPTLKDVRRDLTRPLALQLFREGIDPRVRQLLSPWERKEDAQAAVNRFRQTIRPSCTS